MGAKLSRGLWRGKIVAVRRVMRRRRQPILDSDLIAAYDPDSSATAPRDVTEDEMLVPYTVIYRRITAAARATTSAGHPEGFAAGILPSPGRTTSLQPFLPPDAFPFNR
jgi:hypothetical protein